MWYIPYFYFVVTSLYHGAISWRVNPSYYGMAQGQPKRMHIRANTSLVKQILYLSIILLFSQQTEHLRLLSKPKNSHVNRRK